MKPKSRAKTAGAMLAVCVPFIGIAVTAAPQEAAEPTATVRTEAPPEVKLTRLQGRARESRTQDVVGAMVVVQRAADPSVFYLTTSGADGAFLIDKLPDGDYTVRLNREGYNSEVKTGIQLKYPFRAVVEVTMEPGNPISARPRIPRPATARSTLPD